MGKRISAIVFIYVCTCIGWMILAGTVLVRTEGQGLRLKQAVGRLWGTMQSQHAPVACYTSKGEESAQSKHYLPPRSSSLDVDIALEHRKKGLQWYSTYRVVFAGTYVFANDSDRLSQLTVTFTLPAQNTVYDNFHFFVGDDEIENIDLDSGAVRAALELQPGQSEQVRVTYESQGMDRWYYDFGNSVKPTE